MASAAKETVTFVQAKGLPSSEWDQKKKRPLFSFQRRVLTTSDPKLIAILDERGYPRQQVVEHWTINARKTLEARGVPREHVGQIITILTDAGLKAVDSGSPAVAAVTGNVHGAATMNPVIEKEESPPEASNGGLGRLDLSVG